GLRRGVRRLADLAILCCYRCGVDDRAALAARKRIEREHALGTDRDAAECADKVDLDDEVEGVGREALELARLLVTPGGLDGVAGAGAVDEDALLAVRLARLLEGGKHALLVG